ncbi:hypothetical protein E2562_033563 [Oryza meyeriana var. granulata]|uniref:Secreted protein n=1 Tax=Oryza meyeriana var. granulata TaxID=110450 RepID=A0A6G1CW13_9ORYZ|nr:hypothetical protein E2562_033563 [Oryza meyeriana var. granulata]
MAWRVAVEALLTAELATTSAVPVSISRPAGGWKAAQTASAMTASAKSRAASREREDADAGESTVEEEVDMAISGGGDAGMHGARD